MRPEREEIIYIVERKKMKNWNLWFFIFD